MKSAHLAAPGTLALATRPDPTPADGEVVVELAACGICGTDLEKLRGNYQTTGRIGHEPVGRVAALGRGEAPVAVGDRVFAHHHVGCGRCAVCRHGEPTFCPSYAGTNLDPGGFSERFVVPAANVRAGAVLRLADGVGWETGALLEPAACARTALRRIGFAPGDSLVVVGLGPVGLLYLRVAEALGAGWLGGIEPSGLRRAAARRPAVGLVEGTDDPDRVAEAVRAATGGTGVDHAVVATGAPAAIRWAARLPRRGGTLNLFGLPERGSRLDVDLQALYLAGLRVIPTYATTEPDIAELHDLLVAGRLDLSGIVSHRYPLERIAEAFAMAARPDEALKVVVTGPAVD